MRERWQCLPRSRGTPEHSCCWATRSPGLKDLGWGDRAGGAGDRRGPATHVELCQPRSASDRKGRQGRGGGCIQAGGRRRRRESLQAHVSLANFLWAAGELAGSRDRVQGRARHRSDIGGRQSRHGDASIPVKQRRGGRAVPEVLRAGAAPPRPGCCSPTTTFASASVPEATSILRVWQRRKTASRGRRSVSRRSISSPVVVRRPTRKSTTFSSASRGTKPRSGKGSVPAGRAEEPGSIDYGQQPGRDQSAIGERSVRCAVLRSRRPVSIDDASRPSRRPLRLRRRRAQSKRSWPTLYLARGNFRMPSALAAGGQGAAAIGWRPISCTPRHSAVRRSSERRARNVALAKALQRPRRCTPGWACCTKPSETRGARVDRSSGRSSCSPGPTSPSRASSARIWRRRSRASALARIQVRAREEPQRRQARHDERDGLHGGA